MKIIIKKIDRPVYHTKWRENVILIEEHYAKLGLLGKQVLVGYRASRRNRRPSKFPYTKNIEFNISDLDLIRKAKV